MTGRDETDAAGRLSDMLSALAPDGSLVWTRVATAALLPVVREIADQRAAEELRAAAERTPGMPQAQRQLLRGRAAALRGEPGR